MGCCLSWGKPLQANGQRDFLSQGDESFPPPGSPYLNAQASFHNVFPRERAHHDHLRDLKKPLFHQSSFLTTESATHLSSWWLPDRPAPHGKPWVPWVPLPHHTWERMWCKVELRKQGYLPLEMPPHQTAMNTGNIKTSLLLKEFRCPI